MRSRVFTFDDVFKVMKRDWFSLEQELNNLTGLRGCSTTDLIEGDTFPPNNIRIDESKNLLLEFAVAGYAESEINLTYEKDKITVSVTPEEKEEEKYKYIRRGIKRGKATTSVYVPSSLYDSTSIKAKIRDGILTVTVAARPEVKPVNIGIDIEK